MIDSAILVFIAALITLILRALPFLIFNGKREMPKGIKKVVDVLPTAIMAVLVVYCLKGDITNTKNLALGLSTEWKSLVSVLLALIGVVIAHLWKRNTLLSIVVGTAIYMLLLRIM